MARTVLMAIGAVIGLSLLALAALSFVSAARWSGIGRDGAMVGYNLVGLFLLVAATGCLVGTWNHLYRAASTSSHH